MKLIAQSIDVLMVSGAIFLAIAPFLSVSQPAPSSLSDVPGIAPTVEPDGVEQEERLYPLEPQTRSDLQTTLTPMQRMQLEAALDCNSGITAAVITALNLSPAQQAELMLKLRSTPPQSAEMLTPTQIEQVRQTLPFHP